MKKKIWISVLAVVVLIVIGILVYPSIRSSLGSSTDQTSYQIQEAKVGSLTVNVDGVGTLRSNQTATLSWQTSGTVESILVKNNQTVNNGDTLAYLKQASLSQSIIQATSDLVTAQRELDDLRNSNLAMGQAQLDLANAQDDYNQALWNRKYLTIPNVTNQARIDEAHTSILLAQETVDKAQDYYNGFIESPDSDTTKAKALQTLSNAILDLEELQSTYNYYIDTPSKEEVAITEGEVAVAKAALEDAQREWDRLKDGPDPDDIAAAEAKVAAIQSTIDQIKITAPFKGTVTDISSMVGDEVNAGTTAFRIDDLSNLLVDVPVSEIDINSIQIGQSVVITFDAIQSKEYQGKVMEVSSVGTSDSGTVNFNVTIKVVDPDELVRVGMTAAVNIGTNELENVLLIPSRAVRTEDGKRVVYILENDAVVKKEITLGSSANNYSQVTSNNINAGDKIILNPPTTTTLPMSGSNSRGSMFGE